MENVKLYLCSSGKKLFLTEREAWARLCEVRSMCRKRGDSEPRTIYLCPECNCWHFTSSPKRVAKSRKSR